MSRFSSLVGIKTTCTEVSSEDLEKSLMLQTSCFFLPRTELHSIFSIFSEGVGVYITVPSNNTWLKHVSLWSETD